MSWSVPSPAFNRQSMCLSITWNFCITNFTVQFDSEEVFVYPRRHFLLFYWFRNHFRCGIGERAPRECTRRNVRGCVILCNPGDNSPPCLKCQKISPGCGFLCSIRYSYRSVFPPLQRLPDLLQRLRIRAPNVLLRF